MKKLPERQLGAVAPARIVTAEPVLAPEPAQILARTRFFGGLNERQLQFVARLSALQLFDEGQSVYRIGEHAQHLYVLVDGSVRIAIGMNDRQTSAGDILRHGDVFGWAALTPSANRRIATVMCLTPCCLLVVDGAGLQALMEQDHTLGYRLTTQLVLLITSTLTAFAAG